jgi:archaellum biogenesis ATPase FlaH
MKPEDVFTPRSKDVNSSMYITRASLEQALEQALRGGQHVVIHGESGCGKTWLYSHYFLTNGVVYYIANLANASRFGTISGEFKNIIERECDYSLITKEERLATSAGIPPLKGELESKKTYSVGEKEPFERLLEIINKKAKAERSVLVFDNLENIFSSSDRLKELADIITLCDDIRYSKYNVKILIVGVPSNIIEYFHNTPNLATVANRLCEIPEVSGLSESGCAELIHRGFNEKLGLSFEDDSAIIHHIDWVTGRNPQAVHEYCLELAYVCEGASSVKSCDLETADKRWVVKFMHSHYAKIEKCMNERDTKAGRRNQTLFALARVTDREFKASRVEEIIRAEFPQSTNNVALGISPILSSLNSGDKDIIRRSPKGDAYSFKDPRTRMVLKAMLKKNNERVEKIAL